MSVFTALINLLALSGSLYMLQVYDRVIPSRSLPTLIGLTVLLLGLYTAFGALDVLRTRIMMRAGLRVDHLLRPDVFAAVQSAPMRLKAMTDGGQPLRDLDVFRNYLAGPGPIAMMDLPWMPVYFVLIYLLHPWLGLLATAGGAILVGLTVLSEVRTRRPTARAAHASAEREAFGLAARRNAEAASAMGFSGRVRDLWLSKSDGLTFHQAAASEASAGLSGMTRVLRLFLQSCVLGLGAWLTIRGEATAGVMIAGSIIAARALSPIESTIANWRGFVAARQARTRLETFLALSTPPAVAMQLPRPARKLSVEGVWVAAPGGASPILQNVSFELAAGSGLGIVGPSASGKSTLARTIVGVWQPLVNRGVVRLDDASILQWDGEVLGRDVGYLPQDLQLFNGTVMDNVARFAREPDSASVISAAKAAGAHEMITHLSSGYETVIGEGGAALSAGQRQRLALARALYGDPFLVVLDEPNSNLDAAGDAALAQAILGVRKRGGIVVVVAHRPSALQGLDKLLVLQTGQVAAFGPRDEILKRVAQDASALNRGAGLRAVNEVV